MANGDYPDALKDYQSANKLSTASGEYGLARIYAIKGDVANSLSHLDQNLGSGFKKSEKEILLDPAFGVIENTPEWRQFWKKERYDIFERKISEIEYYISAGKKEDANSALSELTGSYPENNATLYAKALVSFSMEKYSETFNILSRLMVADKKNELYIRLLAKAQTASGNLTGASDSYSELIDMGIADARLFFLRAECYRKTGEIERARKDIGKFLDLYPQDKTAISFAGKIEAESGDNLKALDFFSRNLKLHPNSSECYIDRANSYFVSKTWDYAASDYSMALDLQPDNAEVWLNKGISLLNSGKTDYACHDFRIALHLGNKKATGYISRNCIK
jgi:tetratricopeptide (TPR) repeat protein